MNAQQPERETAALLRALADANEAREAAEAERVRVHEYLDQFPYSDEWAQVKPWLESYGRALEEIHRAAKAAGLRRIQAITEDALNFNGKYRYLTLEELHS